MMKPLIFLTTILSSAVLLSGCIFKPYIPPVEQGTMISKNMIQSLKPGMTKSQVIYILGAPNIQSPYSPNTWYYVYTLQKNHLPMGEKSLILNFKNNQLNSISGDYKIAPNKIKN